MEGCSALYRLLTERNAAPSHKSAKLFILGLIPLNCRELSDNTDAAVDVLIVTVMYMMSDKAEEIQNERERRNREGNGYIMRISK
jgi:hypothetical protein